MKSRLIKNILVATDGSEYTKKAVDYAVEIAMLAEAKIYAIYVLDTGAFASIPMDVAWQNMYELLKKEGDAAIAAVEEKAINSGIEIDRSIIEGHPAEEIIKLSENVHADLIVMGTLGKSGLDRFLLGSVAEKVSRNSKIPVMTVRGEKSK